MWKIVLLFHSMESTGLSSDWECLRGILVHAKKFCCPKYLKFDLFSTVLSELWKNTCTYFFVVKNWTLEKMAFLVSDLILKQWRRNNYFEKVVANYIYLEQILLQLHCPRIGKSFSPFSSIILSWLLLYYPSIISSV